MRRSAQAARNRYEQNQRLDHYKAFIKSHNDDTRIDKIDPSLTQKGVGGQQWMRYDPMDALTYGEPQVRRLFFTYFLPIFYLFFMMSLLMYCTDLLILF